jgi:hypothetical protein
MDNRFWWIALYLLILIIGVGVGVLSILTDALSMSAPATALVALSNFI